jgi:hypothetical protein
MRALREGIAVELQQHHAQLIHWIDSRERFRSRQEGTSSSEVSYAEFPEEDSSTGDPASSQEKEDDGCGCALCCICYVCLCCASLCVVWLIVVAFYTDRARR